MLIYKFLPWSLVEKTSFAILMVRQIIASLGVEVLSLG